MRGRKCIGENAKTEMITIRLTKKEKEVLDKNNWIKKQVVKDLRNTIRLYVQD